MQTGPIYRSKCDYPILVYFNNNKHEWNGQQVAICHYQEAWCKLGFDHKALCPLVGQELLHIHQHNLVPSTHHHSDAEEPKAGQEKGKGINSEDSDDNNEPSPINVLIRQSQVNTPITSHAASPLQQSFTPVNTRVFKVSFPT